MRRVMLFVLGGLGEHFSLLIQSRFELNSGCLVLVGTNVIGMMRDGKPATNCCKSFIGKFMKLLQPISSSG